MAEHSAVNRRVVGSSPTRGVWRSSQVVRQWSATPVSTGSNPVDASSIPETDVFRDFFCLTIFCSRMSKKRRFQSFGNRSKISFSTLKYISTPPTLINVLQVFFLSGLALVPVYHNLYNHYRVNRNLNFLS